MNENSNSLVELLSEKALHICNSNQSEIEKYCWMVVHEYLHGVMPVEYDIREVDEDLYLSVLKIARKINDKIS